MSSRIPDNNLTQAQAVFFGAVVIGEGAQVPFVDRDDEPHLGTLAVLVSPTSLWAYAPNSPDSGDDGTYYLVEWDGEQWREADA